MRTYWKVLRSASFEGRARRSEYWRFAAVHLTVLAVLYGVLVWTVQVEDSFDDRAVFNSTTAVEDPSVIFPGDLVPRVRDGQGPALWGPTAEERARRLSSEQLSTLENARSLRTTVIVLLVLYAFGTLVQTLAVTARRLHDTGVSGWVQLIWSHPQVAATMGESLGRIEAFGWMVAMVTLALDSQPGLNSYGDSEKYPEWTPASTSGP